MKIYRWGKFLGGGSYSEGTARGKDPEKIMTEMKESGSGS